MQCHLLFLAIIPDLEGHFRIPADGEAKCVLRFAMGCAVFRGRWNAEVGFGLSSLLIRLHLLTFLPPAFFLKGLARIMHEKGIQPRITDFTDKESESLLTTGESRRTGGDRDP